MTGPLQILAKKECRQAGLVYFFFENQKVGLKALGALHVFSESGQIPWKMNLPLEMGQMRLTISIGHSVL